jgi:MinD-like ATPase involved in chromosome partitioning or flagellar assembly
MDAYALLKLMKYSNIEDYKYIIVNMCANLHEGKIAFDNLEKAVKHFLNDNLSLLGMIERDSVVTRAILSQKLFLFEHSGSKIAQQIIKVGKEVEKIRQLVNNSQ